MAEIVKASGWLYYDKPPPSGFRLVGAVYLFRFVIYTTR
jgi:hypothetical protein